MPDLSFSVDGAEPVMHAASPLLNFRLQITDFKSENEREGQATIHSIALRCQIRIEPGKRAYLPVERDRLVDLFGNPSRWGQTLRPMLWTHASLIVPPFEGATTVELPVPCTYDFNIAAAKFFHALEGDEVPLCLMFSGTIFYAGEHGMQVAQIPWDKEVNFRLPVSTWKTMMDHYYPNSAWLCLRRDAFDQLQHFKSQHGLPTWEAAIEKLMANAVDEVKT